MARNSINYEGRVIARDKPPVLKRATNGIAILELVLAEQHTEKKGKARKDPALKKFVDDPRNASAGDDDYINTTTSWHKITVFGDKAEEYAQDPNFNHGALFEVRDASYKEEGAWKTKDGIERAGRPESIGDNAGSMTVVERGGTVFGPREPMPPIWDGESELAKPGGGGSQAVEYNDDEGF